MSFQPGQPEANTQSTTAPSGGPPPIPGNRPPSYAPPSGPPPAGTYAPTAGPPPTGAYAPPSGPPPTGAYAPPAGPPPTGYAPSYAPPVPSLYAPPGGPPPTDATRAPAFPNAPQQPYPPPGAAPAFPSAGYPGYQAHMPTEIHYLGATVINFKLSSADKARVLDTYNVAASAEEVKKATKGFGCDDIKLMSVLLSLSPLQMEALGSHFESKIGKNFVSLLDSETKSYFKMGIHALAVGPLMWDVELIHDAVAKIGTDEDALTEILAGRSAYDIHLLKDAYHHRYGKDLAREVQSDLSGKTERLFTMILSGNRTPDNVPVDPAQVTKDVEALFAAGQGKSGTDEMVFCDILVNRNQPHLAAVIDGYARKYRSLTKVIKSEFSGHMKNVFLHIVQGAKPKRDMQGVWRDAKYIFQAMDGIGTKDKQLVRRLVRAHWDPARLGAIKEAYKARNRKDLASRVSSETSGSYKKLMVAIVNGEKTVKK